MIPSKCCTNIFDGFLYWANWGSPRLAFRFPHGILSADLIEGYDFDDLVTFTTHPNYDMLDIHFAEMEAPDMWTEYELGPLMAMRDELMEGDLRSLYITWLGVQAFIGVYEDEEEEEDYEISIPPVPPGFSNLTVAQQALAELLRLPEELLVAAARHSTAAAPASSTDDDVTEKIKLLPAERQYDYLVRLALNEPGLSRLFVRELRELGQDKTQAAPPTGERVSYDTLLSESKAIKDQLKRERRKQERMARERYLQNIHEHQDLYWDQVDKAAPRGTASGYDEATKILIDLRDAANLFNRGQEFRDRFRAWIPAHMRRPAFIKRLQTHQFPLPEM